MKSRSICPSCNAMLEFDRILISVVTCPKCKFKGNVTDFEESIPTEGPAPFTAGKLYKPGKLELLESDAQWLQPEKIVDLKQGANTLGRMSPNSTSNLQLPTDDAYLSRNHAAIDVIQKPGGIFEHRLKDLGSSNGTYHNGDCLEKGDVIKLAPGDIIKLGHTFLKFIAE